MGRYFLNRIGCAGVAGLILVISAIANGDPKGNSQTLLFVALAMVAVFIFFSLFWRR